MNSEQRWAIIAPQGYVFRLMEPFQTERDAWKLLETCPSGCRVHQVTIEWGPYGEPSPSPRRPERTGG